MQYRALLCMLSVMLALGACSQRRFANDADALRERVLDLETQLADLERRNSELQYKLREAQTTVELPEGADEDIREHLPTVTEITIGRLSHARDTTGDGRPDTLMLYIQPEDGMGRFMQIAGEVLVNAVIVPPDDDAITIGRERLGPAEVREAYRSGITGTHYTITVPLTLPERVDEAWKQSQQASVRVSYVSGVTGQRYDAERSIPLVRR